MTQQAHPTPISPPESGVAPAQAATRLTSRDRAVSAVPSVTAVFTRIARGQATPADYEQYMALWDQRAAANAEARRKAA